MGITVTIPEMQNQRMSDEPEGDGGERQQGDEIGDNVDNGALPGTRLLEEMTATHADHKRDDDKDEINPSSRFQIRKGIAIKARNAQSGSRAAARIMFLNAPRTSRNRFMEHPARCRHTLLCPAVLVRSDRQTAPCHCRMSESQVVRDAAIHRAAR